MWWRTEDNASLRRLTRAGRCQQTRNRAYLGGGVGRRGGARSSTHEPADATSADATSAPCDVRSRDENGRQRPRVAPSADRNVHGPRRLRGVTSASRNVERHYVSERCDVSVPQRQARNVKRAKSSAQRRRGATSSAQMSA